jgi:hypothetical protein
MALFWRPMTYPPTSVPLGRRDRTTYYYPYYNGYDATLTDDCDAKTDSLVPDESNGRLATRDATELRLRAPNLADYYTATSKRNVYRYVYF